MKRFLSLLLCALLVCTASFALAEAAPTEENAMIVVYASVPEGWAYPCAWAWAEDGTNAFAAWPGEQMEPDAANEGWYYIYLPATMDNIIVNANDGTVQTEACLIEKANAWITIAEDGVATVSKEALTTGEAPAYTERYTVYAKVDETWAEPGVWAWENESGKGAFSAWPGRAMKANENGWFSARVPVFCDCVIINANAGDVKTADIKELDPADMWITVAADGTFEVTYDDPTAPVAEDITVYAKVPEDWPAPRLWAWSHPAGPNAFTAWPGQAFEQGEDGWYQLKVAGWINSVIVNANEGSVQTSDLRVDAGKDVYVVVTSPEEATFTYEKPAE